MEKSTKQNYLSSCHPKTKTINIMLYFLKNLFCKPIYCNLCVYVCVFKEMVSLFLVLT